MFIFITGWFFAGLGCKPPGARALFNGEKLLQAGNVEEAVEEFEEAVGMLPQEWRAWNYLGLARHQAGDFNGAGEAFQKAVQIVGKRWKSPNDSSFVLYFNQGRLNLDRDRLDDAKRQLHTFASQKQTFKSLFWLAEAFRRNGDMLQAEQTYLLALSKNDTSPVAHNRLGLVQLKLNNPVGAISRFQQALLLQPDFNQAQLNLALTYHRYTAADFPDRDTLALEAFKNYVKKNPKPAAGVQEMMKALQARLAPEDSLLESTHKPNLIVGDTNQLSNGLPISNNTNLTVASPSTNLPINEQLATNLTTVIKITPLSKTNHSNASSDKEVLPSTIEPIKSESEAIKEGSPTTALADQPNPFIVPEMPEMPEVARYKYLKPERPEPGAVENLRGLQVLLEKAYHQHRIKEYDKAIVGYRRVLEMDPAHQQAYVNIAIAMQVTGKVKASLPEYEKALAINPFSQPAREGFASALNQSGFFLDAAVEFHKLLEVHRDNVPAHLGLGVLYDQHLNQPDKAEKYYRRVLELDPQHTEAANIRRWLYNKSQ